MFEFEENDIFTPSSLEEIQKYRKENNKSPWSTQLTSASTPPDLYKHFSLDKLEKCSLDELRNICTLYKIKASGDKGALIEKILLEEFKGFRSI